MLFVTLAVLLFLLERDRWRSFLNEAPMRKLDAS
jgi:hypothetical protein